jgi:GT2 family glycosyltransferase
MKISVVIPTHNRADALDRTLSNLSKQHFQEAWEAIVVNNLCTDDTDTIVQSRSFPVPLRLVHRDDIPGPSAARNAGAAHATGTYLLFMDNDILVEPDFLQRHLRALEKYPGCWIVGQVVNLPEMDATPFGRYRKSLFPLVPTDAAVRETDAITGQNVSMPRADFEALGGFDESFFVASGEDRELLMRAKQKRIKLLLDPGIVVVQNDWAGFTIRDYCFRNRTYMQTEPLFWRKYGDAYPRDRLVIENNRPCWTTDPVRLLLRKRIKQLLGSHLGQETLIGVCTALERLWPWPPMLWRVYRLAIAGAMYSGFQEGLALHNANGKQSGDASQ